MKSMSLAIGIISALVACVFGGIAILNGGFNVVPWAFKGWAVFMVMGLICLVWR